jgi:hypothetical protein
MALRDRRLNAGMSRRVHGAPRQTVERGDFKGALKRNPFDPRRGPLGGASERSE